jgi:glycosyltransferase involved in cell wall biosynthesis
MEKSQKSEKSSLTAVVLTKNSGGDIAACLDGLDFAGEVVVIDNGSTDDTVRIAASIGARVVFEPEADFALLRNRGLKEARSEWIFYLDADERVSAELKNEIVKIVSGENDFSVYKARRQNYFFGVRWPGEEQLERLFRRSSLKKWYGKVHESPDYDGESGLLHHPIFHYTHRDLDSMTAKTNEWSEIEAGQLFSSGHPPLAPWRFARVFLTGWSRSFFRGGAGKMGTLGVIESLFQGFSMFITYAKLWEKQSRLKDSKNF